MSPAASQFYKLGFYTLLCICIGLSAALLRQSDSRSSENLNSQPSSKTESSDVTQVITQKLDPATPSIRSEPSTTHEQTDQLNRTLEKLLVIKSSATVPFTLSFLDKSDKSHLSPELAELFELDPHQVKDLNTAIQRTHEQLGHAISRTVTRPSENKIVIASDPFPEVGAAIYDELTSEIERIIGSEKSTYLIGLVDSQLEHNFSHFGAEKTEFTFERLPTTRPEQDIFRVRRAYDSGEIRGTDSGTYANTDFLREKYPELSPFITPEDLLALPIVEVTP